MYIYMEDKGLNSLQRIAELKKSNHYSMIINGWYGGGFSAPSDTKALEIFKKLVNEVNNNENM